MQAKNPVIPGFHPDPSLLRVGDDYYIATSTFEWWPGVRIHHSKDLVNWQLVSYALTDDALADLTGVDTTCGIWAPNLTYSDGRFWLCYTIVYTDRLSFKDTHNFLVHAESVHGPWSKPVFINCSGFDPSMFHDDDGRKYYLNMTMDYRAGQELFSGIDLQEYDPQTETLLGDPKRIFAGTGRGFTEGPNLFKRDGWYYLVCAEGGTAYEHCVTVARARDIGGPYEECPHNPVLTAWQKDCRLQRAGHGQMIEAADGKWYMAHLCGRPVGGDHCVLGRETAIQNMEWTPGGWPRLAANSCDTPEDCFAPPVAVAQRDDFSAGTDFADGILPIEYMTPRGGFARNGIAVENRRLQIQGGNSPCSKFRQGLVARPLQSLCFDYTATMEFAPRGFNHMAGLLLYYNYDNYFWLRVTGGPNGPEASLSCVVNREIADSAPRPLAGTGPWHLKAEVRGLEAQFFVSEDGVDFHPVGEAQDMRMLSDEHVAGHGFTGAMVGVNCCDLQGDGVYADFTHLAYKEHPGEFPPR